MALKADRRKLGPEQLRYKADAPVVKGSAVILKASQPAGAGVGQALNAAAPVAVNYAGAPPSGAQFLGVSLDTVNAFDVTKDVRTSYPATDRIVGEQFAIGEFYEVWTDQVVTGASPADGTLAYLGADSKFGVTQVSGLAAVGKWKSSKDGDGFALLQVRATA